MRKPSGVQSENRLKFRAKTTEFSLHCSESRGSAHRRKADSSSEVRMHEILQVRRQEMHESQTSTACAQGFHTGTRLALVPFKREKMITKTVRRAHLFLPSCCVSVAPCCALNTLRSHRDGRDPRTSSIRSPWRDRKRARNAFASARVRKMDVS